MKITTHLDQTGHCKTASGTNWSNRWTHRAFIINTRRDEIGEPKQIEQLRRNVFRGGLDFRAQRLLCHSTLGLRVIKKKKNRLSQSQNAVPQRLAKTLRLDAPRGQQMPVD